MKMDGEYTLPTDVENVWKNLNDPLVLKNSIPGCTELIKENDNEFKATVTIKIGPVSAKFNGEVTFKVTFKDLGVPVGFGMTNAIIFHECATQVGLKSPWTKIDKRYKDDRFKVEIIDKKINF